MTSPHITRPPPGRTTSQPLPTDLLRTVPMNDRHAITAFTYAVLGWFVPLFGAVLALIYARRAEPSSALAGAARSMAKVQLLLIALAALAGLLFVAFVLTEGVGY